MSQDMKIESIQKFNMPPVPQSVYTQALAAAKAARLPFESLQAIESLKAAQEISIVQVTKHPSIRQIMAAAKAASAINTIGPLPDVTEINLVITRMLDHEKMKSMTIGPISQCAMDNARSLVETRTKIDNLLEITRSENEMLRAYLSEYSKSEKSFFKMIKGWFTSSKDNTDFYHKTLNDALASSMASVNVALQKSGLVK